MFSERIQCGVTQGQVQNGVLGVRFQLRSQQQEQAHSKSTGSIPTGFDATELSDTKLLGSPGEQHPLELQGSELASRTVHVCVYICICTVYEQNNDTYLTISGVGIKPRTLLKLD